MVNHDKTDEFTIVNGVVKSSVKLLGTVIGNNKAAVDSRIESTRKSFRALYAKLWKTDVSIGTKLRVFKAVCIPTFLYGLESVPLTAAKTRPLDTFAYRSVRSILGFKYDAHVSYENLESFLASEGVEFEWPSITLQRRRVRDFWHFHRHHGEFNLWTPPGGKRGRGRPKTRLIDVVAKDVNKTLRELRQFIKERVSRSHNR